MDERRAQTWVVLGATGYLGRHLAAAARGPGRHVVAVGRRRDRLEVVEADERVALDLLDPAALAALDADVVLNAAALARGGDCERDPAAARAANAELPGRLGQRYGGARLVHVSTDLVFGHQLVPERGFAEDDEPRPASAYGASKLAGERALLAAAPDALVVRVPLLFGPSHGTGAGASDALLAALVRGERPGLFLDEVRTPLDVREAARRLVALAAGDARGLLHVAGPERLTRLELGLRVLQAERGWTRDEALARVEPTTRAAAGLADRPADTSLDGRRAARLLGRESSTTTSEPRRTP